MANQSLCKIEACGKAAINSRGWCSGHYQRWQRHGDPLGGSTPRGDSAGSPARYLREVAILYDGDECLLWPFTTNGAGNAQIRHRGRNKLVSRIVCEEEHGPPPTPKHEAAHSCGKGHEACVTKRHLEWKTPKQNNADKLIHGTHNRGDRCPVAKLTEADVREIRRLLAGGTVQREIATRFGVDQSNISQINRGHSWGWMDQCA